MAANSVYKYVHLTVNGTIPSYRSSIPYWYIPVPWYLPSSCKSGPNYFLSSVKNKLFGTSFVLYLSGYRSPGCWGGCE